MIRAFQWDLARQVERVDFLKALLPRYATWGYEELYLHLEDAVHYPSLPGIGRDDAYTYQELGELVLVAAQNGIRVVPIVNLLGHTQYLIKHPEWRDLNELRDERGRPLETGQICPLHPRTMEIADKLLRDVAPYCTAGKVHVGLDESFHLGKCPRCREEVARLGLGGHFAGHVNRLHKLCDSLNLAMGLWADMLYFTPEAIPLLPRGITAYDWYYYPFNRKPRVEFFNFAERDLLPALRQQGIAYYGCPMNGSFRHEPLPVFGDRLANIRSWWQRCTAVKAEGFLVTSWEPQRLALETTTLVDAAAANLWREPEADDATSMLARGLERVFSTKAPRDLARTLLAADECAFAGYARWQINDRWDVFAGNEGLKNYEHERKFFTRLNRVKLPAPLAASVAFRLYLAERDVFVRQAARDVFKLRRMHKARPEAGLHLKAMEANARQFAIVLKAGRKAAQAMWRQSRDPQVGGPNETVMDLDERRLTDWRAWLKRAVRQPKLTWGATPVCGAWQLQFMVHNFAPAVQKVIVEQQDESGAWRELAARFTIEFRAAAARPHSKLKREFTVPVEIETWSAGGPAREKSRGEVAAPPVFPPLRIAVRGVGQVSISHVTLANGMEVRRAKNYPRKKIIGRRAPHRGFPSPDWQVNQASTTVRFSPISG
jgi:hypothetical protein